MDNKTSKRIDSLYRNMKQLPLLALLAILVPLLLPMVPLLCLAYLYLRSSLLRAIDRGEISIDRITDGQAVKVGEIPVLHKLEYIRNSGGRLQTILLIFVAVSVIIVGLLVAFAST